MNGEERGGGRLGDDSPDHTSTPVSVADVVRVVSRALSERTVRLHLTAGQRRAILGAPLRPGASSA